MNDTGRPDETGESGATGASGAFGASGFSGATGAREPGEPSAPTEPTIDWDLLQPTLTARDDFVGFGRPFSPWIVLVVAVICRPVVGSWLFAYNAWQLGLKRQVVPLIAAGFLAAVAVFAVFHAVVDGDVSATRRSEQSELLGFVLNVSGALVGLLVFRGHRRRYRLFLLCEGRSRSLWVVGTLSVVASLFFLNGIAYAIVNSLVRWVMGEAS
jgi:hypothetical protein